MGEAFDIQSAESQAAREMQRRIGNHLSYADRVDRLLDLATSHYDERETHVGSVDYVALLLMGRMANDTRAIGALARLGYGVDEMRVPRSLLDLMYSVPPGEMRILSRDEIELFLPSMDPVYEEQRVTASARSYGVSNFEYRAREKKADDECEELLANLEFYEWENCKKAILWSLTLEEYLVREVLSRKACLEGVLDRSALRVPPGLNARDCRVYVMRHGA